MPARKPTPKKAKKTEDAPPQSASEKLRGRPFKMKIAKSKRVPEGKKKGPQKGSMPFTPTQLTREELNQRLVTALENARKKRETRK